MPRLEGAVAPAGRVERHQRARYRPRGLRPAIRAARKGRRRCCCAHGSSSAAVAGRHVKIRRRLGVSPGPVALNGPVIVNVSMCGQPGRIERVGGAAQVRLQPHGVRCASALLEERDADLVRPAALSGTRTCSRVVDFVADRASVFSRSAAEIVARRRSSRDAHAAPSTRDLELLLVFEPADRAEIRAEADSPGYVLAVERKVVARRACRRPFRAAGRRRAGPATRPGGHGRSPRRGRVGIADRERADLPGRRQIPLEQRRRTRRARRQRCRSHTRSRRAAAAPTDPLRGQQVANGVGVLGAVQAMQRAAGPDRDGAACASSALFEPRSRARRASRLIG